MSGPYFTTKSISVEPWRDHVIDRLGHEPRSRYVELFWLGHLGPSSVWLLRHLTAHFDRHPNGYALDLDAAAAAIGLTNPGGKHSAFMRCFARLSRFGMARAMGPDELAVRRRVPSLNLHQVERLPHSLQQEHRRWVADALERDTGSYDKARELALTLVEQGEGVDQVEHMLARWAFDAKISSDAASWAWEANLARMRG